MTTYRLPLTKDEVLLIMDALCHATMPNFKVGRTYKGKPTLNTEVQLAELYQTVGQAMGEQNVFLEFTTQVTDLSSEPQTPARSSTK